MSHRIRNPVFKDKSLIYALTACGGCAFLIPYGLQTIFIDNYSSYYEKKKVHSTLEAEFPVKVSTHMKDRFNEVLDTLKFDEFKKNLGSIFVTSSSDIFCIGSTYSRLGFKLGIPQNYLCQTEEEIRKLDILADDRIPWDTADGELLTQSLLLSDLAQKYAFAKYVSISDTYRILIIHTLPLALVSLANEAIKYADRKCRGTKDPFRNKSVAFVSISLFYFCAWLVLYDSINMLYENNCDDVVFQRGGKSYMLGAEEYYDKLIKRNMIMWKLTKTGKKYYKENGDYKRSFRLHIPLSAKKMYIEDMLKKEYNEEQFRQIPTPRTMH